MLKILRFLKPSMPLVILGIFFLFCQAIADISLPTIMSQMVNEGMVTGNIDVIYSLGAKMLLVSLISGACSISAGYFSSVLGTRLGRDLRSAVFNKVENFSLNEFDKIGSASLITRTTNDITQIQQVVVIGFRFVLYSPLMMIGGLFMSFKTDKELALLLLISIPLIVILMFFIAKAVIPLFKIMQEKVDNINLVLSESLQGIRVIRAFNKIDSDKQKFEKANVELMDVSVKANRMMAIMQPGLMLIMNISTVAIVWFGGHFISNGSLEIGDMMAFIQYSMLIMFSAIMVSVMFVMIPRAQASADRINEVLEMETEVVDPKNPKSCGDKKGYIEFKNVSFSYPEAEEAVLENITFKTNPGETTAIIGSTGSGKSTIVNLIPRFYDVTSGQILIDDVDIRDITQYDLREKIGFVPQKAVLFSGTISENMRFGKKDATDEEIYKACEIAQATDFISKLENGFDSKISQGGTNLSGGQRQRLSIARAIVKEPEIYVFDDSFSALDFKTDKLLRNALKEVTKESSVIVIAQRITSVIDADRIIVLDEGKVVGNGTHDELYKNCDVYKEIVASQLEEEEL